MRSIKTDPVQNVMLINAIRERLYEIYVQEKLGKRVDILIGHKLALAGVFENLETRPVPVLVQEEIQRQLEHGEAIVRGPLIFVQDKEQANAYSIETLLLSNEKFLRELAARYLLAGMPCGWMGADVADLVSQSFSDLCSEEPSSWRKSAIRVVEALRNDILFHFAALTQSIEEGFDEGIDRHFEFCIRPPREVLSHACRRLCTPSREHETIKKWIEEFGDVNNILEALDQYIIHCGFVPLADGLDAVALVRRWKEKHSDTPIGWIELSDWARGSYDPIRYYHAAIIALSGELKDSVSVTEAWNFVRGMIFEEEIENANLDFTLHGQLVSHYVMHLESMFPFQDSERVCTTALWLASKLLASLIRAKRSRLPLLVEAVSLVRTQTLSAWILSRSRVQPSSLRATLLTSTSVLSLSMFLGFCSASEHGRVVSLVEAGESFNSFAKQLLITTEVSNPIVRGETSYGFQDSAGIFSVLKEFVDESELEAFRELLDVKVRHTDSEYLSGCISEICEKESHLQFFTSIRLRYACLASDELDDKLSDLVLNGDFFQRVLASLPIFIVDTFLDVVCELCTRLGSDFALRIAHHSVIALEEIEDKDRTKLVFGFALGISINSGFVSPIERAMTIERWRSVFVEQLEIRQTLFDSLARSSDIWSSSRIRAANACLSRLVGPLSF